MGQPGFLRPLKSFKMWWPGTDLNRRRQPFQGCALPTELPGRGNFSVATSSSSRNAQSCLTAIPHRRSKAVGKPHNRGCFLGLAPHPAQLQQWFRVLLHGHPGPPRRAPGSAEAPRYASAGCRSGVSLPQLADVDGGLHPVPWCQLFIRRFLFLGGGRSDQHRDCPPWRQRNQLKIYDNFTVGNIRCVHL